MHGLRGSGILQRKRDLQSLSPGRNGRTALPHPPANQLELPPLESYLVALMRPTMKAHV